MHETTTPPNNPQPSFDYVVPHSPKSRKKIWIIGASITAALLIVLAAVLVESRSSKNTAATQTTSQARGTLTLYYRDGKTAYWNSSKDPDWLGGNTPGFVGEVVEDLKAQVDTDKLSQGDWKVTTTLDASLQKTAEENMQASQNRMKHQRVKNAAIIAEDVTNGQVVSWVGHMVDESEDIVTQDIKVGTLALPLTYAATMDATTGITPDTQYDDAIGQLPGYACTNRANPTAGGNCLYNFDYKFLGRVSVRQALGGMRLVPAVKAALPLTDAVGTGKLQSYAEGLTTDGKFACYRDEQLREEGACYTAAVFGDGLFASPSNIIQAYATLANEGKKLPQTTVLKAIQDGKVRYEWRQPSAQQAMKSDTAKNITSILSDPGATYLSAQYKDGFTAQGTKISVMMGLDTGGTVGSVVQYSSRYAIGVWMVGDDQGIAGSADAAVMPAASVWMKSAH